jgi:hypothetical protein
MIGGEFNPSDLLELARSRTGYDDYGDDDLLEPLAVLCASLDTEAPLTATGRTSQRERLLTALSNRLRLNEWFRRHPEIAAEDVGPPVVIVGLPRTGTTMLYRMLAAAEGLTPPLYYEAVQIAPAFDWDFKAETDPRIAAGHESVSAMMAAMPELASIYPFEALAPEESIYLYRPAFRSTHEQSSALVPSYDAWFRDSDKRPAYRYLARVLQFLQWQRRRSGRHRDGVRWLLKTPDHIHGLQELLEVFPEAHVIQTHRDPVQTIPSICSFIRVLHSTTTSRDDSIDIGQAWSQMFAYSMGRALKVRDANPARFLDIWYRDTVADPRKVAEEVFSFLGRPLTKEGWAEMQKWREANKREERPAHSYTLEEFGLSQALIKKQFRDYREKFIEPNSAL